MHHIIAYAQLMVCDSQTMAAESGVLGTPFIRYILLLTGLDTRRIGKKYGLGVGVKMGNEEQLLSALDSMLATDDYKIQNLKRKDKI